MTGKTHLLGGIAFGCTGVIAASVVAPEILQPLDAGTFIMGSAVGALVPDIDHPSSVFSRKMPLIAFPYRVVAAIDKLVCKLLKKNYHMGHRGITHSLIPTTLLLALLMAYLKETPIFILLLGLLVGCYSHIVLDMLNPSGVPILLPVSDKRFRLIPKKLAITTKNIVRKNGMANQAWKENAFAGVVLVMDAAMLFLIMKGVLR